MTLIWKSIDRTKLILFQPFDIKKWLKLLLIACLAGAMGIGSGISGTGNDDVDIFEQAMVHSSSMAYAQDWPVVEKETSDSPWSAFKNELSSLGWPNWVIAVFVLIILAFGLLLMWLAARFKFIWYDSIVYNVAEIVKPFRKYRPHGNSLFRLFVVLGIVTLIFSGLMLAWVYSIADSAGLLEDGIDWSWRLGIEKFGAPLLISAVFILVFLTFQLFVNQFVVPIMAMDNVSFQLAWSKFMTVLKANVKDLFVYLAVTAGLLMAAGFLVMIVMFILLFIILLLAGFIFIIAYYLIVTLLKAKMLFTIFTVMIGTPFIIALVLFTLSISLPVAVFLRYFSLYYLTSLNCGYSPLDLVVDDEMSSEDV